MPLLGLVIVVAGLVIMAYAVVGSDDRRQRRHDEAVRRLQRCDDCGKRVVKTCSLCGGNYCDEHYKKICPLTLQDWPRHPQVSHDTASQIMTNPHG